MKRFPLFLLLSIFLIHISHAQHEDVLALLKTVAQQAKQELWPNFEPLKTPLALFDGETTYLIGHPSPPSEFEPVADLSGLFTYEGRHPNVIANTTALYNDVLSATVMLRKPIAEHNLTDLAALIMHERFHAFQRPNHPTWQSNEADLFIYPFEDVEQLAERRKETEALRRAFAGNEKACWASHAMQARQTRYETLDSAFVAYERGADWNEGIAKYIELKAKNSTESPITRTFEPDGIRWRAYDTGSALGLLLDTFNPEWQTILEENDKLPMDQLLADALPQNANKACGFTEAEASAIRAEAEADIESFIAQRKEKRAAFFKQRGWTITIHAAAERPFWPQGFDPLNVVNVGNQEILHTRYVKVGNDQASIEIVGAQSLTRGAGTHPLFNGVRTFQIKGLPDGLLMKEDGDTISLTTDTVTLTLQNANLEQHGYMYIIRLQ